MRISNQYFNPAFQARIIDSHAHIGKFLKPDKDNEFFNYTRNDLEPFFRKTVKGDKVEHMIVSDLTILSKQIGEKYGNESLLWALNDPSKYTLIASCNVEENVSEISKLLDENPNRFKGLKFHPHMQNRSIEDEIYKPYFELASKKEIPCIIHTSVEVAQDGSLADNLHNFSDPRKVYEVGKKHPKTPFVMAHLGAGGGKAHEYTVDTLIESIKKGDANLYADISWVDIANEGANINERIKKDNVIKAIKRLKGIGEKDWKYGDQSFRLMFGSDAPLARFSWGNRQDHYFKFVEEIQEAIRNDSELKADADKIIDDLFYNNAKKLYNIPDAKAELPPRTISNSEKNLLALNKNMGKVALGVAGFFGLGLVLAHINTKKEAKENHLSLVG